MGAKYIPMKTSAGAKVYIGYRQERLFRITGPAWSQKKETNQYDDRMERSESM
ncbi:hypothetical protein PM8797T_25930 [Gimesia maris DSM 8797]|nr:hypothetical protein PM8797T_25930 [Gimesia maris DSM 8797]